MVDSASFILASAAFHKILAKQGIKFRLGTKFLGAQKNKNGASYSLDLENIKDGSKDKVKTYNTFIHVFISRVFLD